MSDSDPDLLVADSISQSAINNISRMLIQELEEFYTSPQGIEFFSELNNNKNN